jgi:hypothetical protein
MMMTRSFWHVPTDIAAALSRIHPLVFLVGYLLSIPTFAAIYYNLPQAFYAPYASLEYTGKNDIYDTGVLLQDIIRKNIVLLNQDDPVAAHKIIVSETHIYVQRASAKDDAIRFDLLVMVLKPTPMQLSIPVVIRRGSTVVMPTKENEYRIFRFCELGSESIRFDDSLGQGTIGEVFSAIFHVPDNVFGGTFLELSISAQKRLETLFDGMAGDPTAISGAYLRMLYFSAIVITTVGFGDIVPISNTSRAAVAAEAVLGIVLAGLFLNAVAFRASGRI